MSDEDLPQETEEKLNEKAGISVLKIENSENVSTMTENYLLDMETTTLASSMVQIAPSFNTSRYNLPTTPHQVGTSIVEVPSPDRQNPTNLWDDDTQDNGYDSDGEIGTFYDALEEESEKYYYEDDMIPERYYDKEYDIEIFELPDTVLEVATAVNVPGDVETYGCNETCGNELSEPIPILRNKFFTLEKTECYFCQAGMPTNYYCTVEYDNGQRSLDEKRVCGDDFFMQGEVEYTAIEVNYMY